MKKLLFGGLGALILSLALIASQTSASNVMVGNPTISRANVDTYSNFTIIDTNNPVSANGTLDTFSYYAANINPFEFVLVDASNTVKWISPTVTPGATGPQTYPATVPVQAGWNLGVHFDSTGTIPYDYVGTNSVWTANNSGSPTVGQTLTIETGVDNPSRTYSWSATGTPTPVVSGPVVYEGRNSCSTGTTPVLISNLTRTIDSQTATPTTVTLPSAGEYLFEATGNYGYGGDPANNTINRADAGYATGDNWTNELNSTLGIAPGATYRGVTSLLSDMGTGIIGIADWGTYNSSHDYKFDYNVTSSTNVQFVISDWYGTWYDGGVNNNQGGMGDNQGNLTLNVYQCEPNSTSPSVTTDAATTPVGITTATVNGTNGPVAADNSSFWWGTTPITGTLVSGNDPGSSEFPSSGWTHDSGTGAAGVGAAFSGNLTGLTPNTKYYFVAWVQVAGIWYPGQILNFITSEDNSPTPSVITDPATTITATGATLNGTDGGTYNADNTSFWWGTTPLPGALVSGADPASTSEFPAGWHHDSGLGGVSTNGTFSEPLTGLTSGTTYYFVAWVQVAGIWYPGQMLAFSTDIPQTAVAACPANTTPTLVDTVQVNSSSSTATSSNISLNNSQQYLLVSSGTWQNGGINVADTEFASVDSWASHMLGYNISPYFLGSGEFQLQVNGNFVPWGSYNAPHTYTYAYTGAGVPINLGVFDGDSNTNTPNPGWYGDNSGTLSVGIYQCTPTTGSLTVIKDTNGGNSTFNFTSDIPGNANFSITTSGTNTSGTGTSQTFSNLTPGTYHVTETTKAGWTMTDTECSAVTIGAGDVKTCTITNTNNKLLGEIRGTKYEDRDGDGKLTDGDHHRLSGVTINLYNSSGNTLLATTTTDSHGNYHFGGLVAGTYKVSEVVQNSSWVETYPSNKTYTVVLGQGQIVKKENFGNFHLGTISGMKYNDQNGDGRKESTEAGIPNIEIDIKGPNGFSSHTTTGTDGSYSFSGLTAGTYTLTEVVPSGWRQTDHPDKIKVQSGTVYTKAYFGNTQKVDKDSGHDFNFGHNWGMNHDGNGNIH